MEIHKFKIADMSPKNHSTVSHTALMEEFKACMAGVRTAFLKGACMLYGGDMLGLHKATYWHGVFFLL